MATLARLSIVEMYLSAAWTDVSADVILSRTASYGIQGGGPNDRTAPTGTFKATLNNSDSNSAGLSGYYSPGHVNCRTGFDMNVPIRWRIPTSGSGSTPRPSWTC